MESGEKVWAFSAHDEAGGDAESVLIQRPVFIDQGATVLVATFWKSEAPPPDGVGGLHFLDATTGAEVRFLQIGECGTPGVGFFDFSDQFALSQIPICGSSSFDDHPMYRIDLATGDATQELSQTYFRTNLSDDEALVAYSDDPVTVANRDTGQVVLEVADVRNQVAALSPDG